MPEDNVWRKTGQFLLPQEKNDSKESGYDIYPTHKIKDDQIYAGYRSLADIIKSHKVVIIDGYQGVFFDDIRKSLDVILKENGLNVKWLCTVDFLKTPEIINELKAPFLGGDDPVFGKITSLKPEDFFDTPRLKSVSPDPHYDINIIIGPGASLSGMAGFLIYADIPKNELQFRARAGSVTNLGALAPGDPKEMYKCFYFVDWVVLNSLKQNIFPEIDVYIDTQNYETPVWIEGDVLRESLREMSQNLFRVRPWFEPGVWGGTWIKEHINGLNKSEPNYAWSFELIVPENGLLIESSSQIIEVSFDSLMYMQGEAVLGKAFSIFGINFPIRFDFLDTFDGGNLSLQCHPTKAYMKQNFGENFTQEETYYILDSKEDAVVYLGFKEDIDPHIFREDLEKSFAGESTFNPDKYILKHPAAKHDLFLIPPGTIHGSGKNNLVLEISSTPYIFTFKMYDWERPDLDGKPRPLNIKRGMENLRFDRNGKSVETLISRPVLNSEGDGWKLFDLPTHDDHLYKIQRYHFTGSIEVDTDNNCLVMSLVEGQSIIIETRNGLKKKFNYAETFVIPAASGGVTIRNATDTTAIIVLALVK